MESASNDFNGLSASSSDESVELNAASEHSEENEQLENSNMMGIGLAAMESNENAGNVGMMGQNDSKLADNPLANELRNILDKTADLGLENGDEKSNQTTLGENVENIAVDSSEMMSLPSENSETNLSEAKSENENSSELTDDAQKHKQIKIQSAFNDGRKKGYDLGRSVGLGKKVETDENGKITIGEDFIDKGAAFDFANVERANFMNEVNSEKSADENAVQIAAKKIEGFNIAYNDGYQAGVRMKMDLQKSKLENNSDFQLGKEKGALAGSMAASGNLEKSNELKAEANTHPSSEYRQGFYKEYNNAFLIAKNNQIQTAKNESSALKESSEEYAKGFDIAEKIAADYVNGEIDVDEYNLAIKNSKIDTSSLFQQGFAAGINSGYFKAKEEKVKKISNSVQGPQKEDPNYIHFFAGQVYGNLAGQSSKETALKALMDKNFDTGSMVNRSEIPAEIYDYFSEKKHEKIYQTNGNSDNSEECSLFEQGYFSSFNKAFQLAQADKISKLKYKSKSVDYNTGAELGAIAGEASARKEGFDYRIKEIQQKESSENNNQIVEELFKSKQLIDIQLDNISNQYDTATDDFKEGFDSLFNQHYHLEKNKEFARFFQNAPSYNVEGSEGLLSSELKEEAGNDEKKQSFFVKGYNLAYYRYYKFSIGTENANPEIFLKKKIDKFKKELTEENEEEEDPKEKISNLSSKIDEFFELFKKGIQKGKSKGTLNGNKYKEGFQDAISGNGSNSRESYYVKGYNEAKKEKEYQDFRDAVMQNEEQRKNAKPLKKEEAEDNLLLPFEGVNSVKAEKLYDQLKQKIKEASTD